MKLLQELFAQGLLSETQVEDFGKQLKKLGKTEEEIILDNKIVAEDFLFSLKSKISGIPLEKINADKVPLEVL